MIADRQTHELPERAAELARVAAFPGLRGHRCLRRRAAAPVRRRAHALSPPCSSRCPTCRTPRRTAPSWISAATILRRRARVAALRALGFTVPERIVARGARLAGRPCAGVAVDAGARPDGHDAAGHPGPAGRAAASRRDVQPVRPLPQPPCRPACSCCRCSSATRPCWTASPPCSVPRRCWPSTSPATPGCAGGPAVPGGRPRAHPAARPAARRRGTPGGRDPDHPPRGQGRRTSPSPSPPWKAGWTPTPPAARAPRWPMPRWRACCAPCWPTSPPPRPRARRRAWRSWPWARPAGGR